MIFPRPGNSAAYFRRRLRDSVADRSLKSCLVDGGEFAELANDQTLLKRGKDRLDSGRLEKPSSPPLFDPDFSRSAVRPELTGDGHHDDVWFGQVIGDIADDHSKTLFGCRLIGKRKRHQHDIAEFECHGAYNVS